MNTPPGHPTLLTMPSWGGPCACVEILPLPAAEYELRQVLPDWFEVRERSSGSLIWSGLGPASVTVSQAPF
ncbi:hypothetical protein [Acidovorax sp. FG27]|uniref:hypothetical protein n=1 Tax=Acidovorax sp. FG27 TaxID=3133652 RepID=UPI0030E79F42